IYDRDKEIANFKPEDYFKLTATFQTDNNQKYQGTYMDKAADKFKKKETLENIQKEIMGRNATITDKQVKQKKEFPPFLFNLSNLQGYMTSKYNGWTSDKVLKVAQTLYEKKFITYPRTSSTALDESLVGKTAGVLKTLSEDLPYKDEIKFIKSKRVFNNAKVESHSAIIPTYMKPRSLTPDQQLVHTAVKNRFIMQFMPVAEYEETKLTTKMSDVQISGLFHSKGKVQLVEGWKKVEQIQSKDVLLPIVQEKEIVNVADSEISSHATKPPKQHTEKTLLRVMETCGKNYKEDDVEALATGCRVGAPARRALTTEKPKAAAYIRQKQKSLACTELGRKLVASFPSHDLFDLDFTGRLEKTLS